MDLDDKFVAVLGDAGETLHAWQLAQFSDSF